MKNFLKFSKKRKIVVFCALLFSLVFGVLFIYSILTFPKTMLIYQIDQNDQEVLYQKLQSEQFAEKLFKVICFGGGGVISFIVLGYTVFANKK